MTEVYFCDGSASPNPGTGGYAVIHDSKPVGLGGDKETTNIRMEGKALIHCMKLVGDQSVEIHTDSEFWINVLTKWIDGWHDNGWKKKQGQILNLDIVKELYDLYKQSNVKLVWVKGHVGITGNELADTWANKAREAIIDGKDPMELVKENN